MDRLEGLKAKSYDSFNAKMQNIMKQIVCNPLGQSFLEVYSDVARASKQQYIKQRFSIVPLDLERAEYIGVGEAMLLLKTEYSVIKKLCALGIIKCHESTRTTKTKKEGSIRLVLRKIC